MECKKIKSLLSEYLDKTLRNDLSSVVKEHLLSCKNCSNDFFLMKSITGELAGLERIKAPVHLLNRVNQTVTSPSWFRKILDFIPGSGGLKLPMEYLTLATTIALVFLIFSNIHTEKKENVMVADSGSKENILSNESRGPVRLDFIPAASLKSGTLPSDTDNVISVARGRASGINRDNLISKLNGMVGLAGGDIVSREFARDSGNIDAITVKIPLNSYSSFIDRAEKMGRFNPPAPSLPHQSPDPVLLRIRLNLSE